MKVKLDLQGLQRQGFPETEIDAVLNEAKSGDYNHLLNVLMAHTEE